MWELNRRSALGAITGGLSSLGLVSALQAETPTNLKRSHFLPRVKRVIHLFMNGGPFQGDFFDHKPAINQFAGQRPAEVQLRTENATSGLLAVPFGFRPRGASGLEVSNLLPEFGELIDDVCVLRCYPGAWQVHYVPPGPRGEPVLLAGADVPGVGLAWGYEQASVPQPDDVAAALRRLLAEVA